MNRPARTWALLAGVIAATVTLAITLVPSLRYTYHAPAARVAIEAAAAVVALVVAYLFLGRYVRSRRLNDLLLAAALALLSLANVQLAIVLAVDPEGGRTPPLAWFAASGHLVGAFLFAGAAFAGDRRLDLPRRTSALFAVAIASAVAGIAAAASVVAPDLWTSADPSVADTRWPRPFEEPGQAALLLLMMAAYVAAAFGFARRAEARSDELLAWLAVAATLGAAARLNYLLFPSFYSEWLHVGDVFRALFYVVLFAAAAREIQRYWRGLASTAVLEERRRIARDLHDGLAQELAFIDRRARRLGHGDDETIISQIVAASERALGASRRAIATLTRPLDEPLAVVLRQATDEVAARAGIDVDFTLDPRAETTAESREALVKIACEAVTNAGRHSGAPNVRLDLASGERLRLRITDAGKGFDTSTVGTGTNGGFGLTSMRERAAAMGADFRVRSRPGEGTTVEVVL